MIHGFIWDCRFVIHPPGLPPGHSIPSTIHSSLPDFHLLSVPSGHSSPLQPLHLHGEHFLHPSDGDRSIPEHAVANELVLVECPVVVVAHLARSDGIVGRAARAFLLSYRREVGLSGLVVSVKKTYAT